MNCIKLKISSKVYSLLTIYATCYIFLDRAYILLDKDNKTDRIIVYIWPKNKRDNFKKISLEFYNELLNYAHYFSSLKVNAEAIKTLTQRALFSAAPSLVQEAEEKEIEELIKELETEEKKEKQKIK